MSASLVGSEMCIRDRTGSAADTGQTKQGQARPSQAKPRPSQTKPRQGTVSYTHLTLPTICSV
eukprot:6319481-Alexandrium_andersonii.AAC.1